MYPISNQHRYSTVTFITLGRKMIKDFFSNISTIILFAKTSRRYSFPNLIRQNIAMRRL